MDPVTLYFNTQESITHFMICGGGMLMYFGALGLLRFWALVAKACGHPYAYTSYSGNGGRSPHARKNSAPLERPKPRILLLNGD